jgi:hypothetical protein
MTARLPLITLWVAAGHAAVFGLFWALIQVPESSLWMLGLSAVLTVAIVIVAGWIEITATLAWLPGRPVREVAQRGLKALPVFLIGLLLAVMIWWAGGRGAQWLADHRGEIDAWLMLHVGWTRPAALHGAVAWVFRFIRYPLAVSVGLTAMATGALAGFRHLARPRWLARALAPAPLLLIGFLLLACIWAPLEIVYWRPRRLPPTWIEPVFVGAKLASIYLLANVGWALVLRVVARRVAATGADVR